MTLESHARRTLIAAIGSVGAVGTLAGCLGGTDSQEEWALAEALPVSHAVQYNGPNCDCCEEYATYLADQLDSELTTHERDDLISVKRELGVPGDLNSCHTVEIDDYVVEGHVPAAVIATLIEQQPDIVGIALPGMPAGSPGMPGKKDGSWTVYAFDQNGTYEPFVDL